VGVRWHSLNELLLCSMAPLLLLLLLNAASLEGRVASVWDKSVRQQ